VIAGKQNLGAGQGKAKMVRRVPGREQRLEAPALARESVAMLEGNVGHKIDLQVLAARGAGALGAARQRPVAVACGLGPGGRDQRRQAVDVVVVGVGDKDVGEPPPADGAQDRGQVLSIIGPRIDQRQMVGADEIGIGALKGKMIGVVGDDPHHPRSELARFAVGEAHCRLKGRGFAHQASGSSSIKGGWRLRG